MRSTLTDNGRGMPIFLSALAWGWHNLRINRTEIEAAYQWGRARRLIRRGTGRLHGWAQ
ncbi:hypothetical protein ACXPVS_06565 [Pseudomonas sp. Ma2-10]